MKPNTIIIVVAALSLAAGAYWYFFTGTGNEPSLSASPQASGAQIRFQTLAGQLPKSLDTTVFSDPRFGTFSDITQAIQPEPFGRIDPLAPIPGVAAPK